MPTPTEPWWPPKWKDEKGKHFWHARLVDHPCIAAVHYAPKHKMWRFIPILAKGGENMAKWKICDQLEARVLLMAWAQEEPDWDKWIHAAGHNQ